MKTTVAIFCTWAALAVAAVAQTGAIQDGFPALRFRHQEGKRTGSYYVELVQYGNEPAFRIRAHHYHAWCNGYFYITPTMLVYDASLTPAQKDAIAVRREDVVSFVPRFTGYEFAAPGKPYKLAFLSDPDRPLQATEQDQRQALMKFVALAYSDFGSARRQFFAILAGVKDMPNNGAMPVFDAKPAISILDPAGALPNMTVDGDGPAQPVVGVVSASTGVVTVVVNGDPVKVTSLSKEVALFQTGRFDLAQSNTSFSVTATAADGNQTSMAFTVLKPDLRFTSPTKARTDKIKLQGTVAGMRDITGLKIAGKPAQLQARSDGGFDFQSADVPLAVGPNFITGYTVATNGKRSTFSVAVTRLAPVPPLTVQGIERLLQSSVSPVRIATLVDERGVDFELTPELTKRLRSAGALQPLLDAIADAYAPPAPPSTNASVDH